MPIKLVIEEDEEVIEKSIAEKLESLISDDDMVLTIKWNIPTCDPDEVLSKIVLQFPINDINRYLEHCGAKIKYSSIGYHMNGDHKIPHIHYHLITEHFVYDKNPSQHRYRWFTKNGTNEEFRFITIKKTEKIDNTKPKYSTLAYPLKEGHSLRLEFPDCYKNIDEDTFKFLKDVGQAIYNQECGIHLRTAKCEERKKNQLLELNELVEKNKNNFKDFHGMLLWLDQNYISSLTITEYPDPKNYKTNCQKIAVRLGFLSYSKLCV